MSNAVLLRRLTLTSLLAVGFSFQNCDECNCPKPKGLYSDIEGMTADSYRRQASNATGKLKADEEVPFADYVLGISYQLDYFSAQLPAPTQQPGVSLMSQAMACSCVMNGELGSKERLRHFTVVTLQDFDAQHLANDTINDLLSIFTYPAGMRDLAEYLRTDTAVIQTEGYTLFLKKRPELQSRFAARVTITLRNGESYSATTLPVLVR